MGDKIRRFMQGRYGIDQLNRFLVVLSFITLLLSFFLGSLFSAFGLGLIICMYYRAMSKQIGKRYAENQYFMKLYNRLRGWLWKQQQHQGQRKTHKFYKCPNCKQKVRIPKGVGKIEIHCPKCSTSFVKKS